MMLPLIALLTLSGFSQPSGPIAVNQQVKKYTEWKTLDELAEAVRKDAKLPGLCIAYQKIGEQPEFAVSGLRSTQNTTAPIEDDDKLLVCNIGKSMTATMIARLIELSKFGWGTTLAEALPDIPMQDAYKKVTIEKLLRHQGGIPQASAITRDVLNRIVAKGQTATDFRKAYVTELLSRDPSDPADPQAASTDTDYVVAGYAAERIIRQSYEWLMERYVFNPMKMATATIAPVGSEDQVGSSGAVSPHVSGDFGYTPYLMPIGSLDSIMAPAGSGVSCSISDLLKYASFHLRGLKGDAQVLNAASYKRLHSAPAGDTHGIGWIINPDFSGELCHSFTGTNGTFYADMTIWPDSGFAIVSVTNAGTTRAPAPTMTAILSVRDRLEQKN